LGGVGDRGKVVKLQKKAWGRGKKEGDVHSSSCPVAKKKVWQKKVGGKEVIMGPLVEVGGPVGGSFGV